MASPACCATTPWCDWTPGPEGVHQARVATRSLRSDLRTFRGALDTEWVAGLREELGWLGAELGQARDADVLLDRLAGRAQGLAEASQDGVKRVIDGLAQRRAEAQAGLLVTLSSDRYLDLIDRLVAAAQSPALIEANSNRPAANTLPAIVRRASQPLEKKVNSLNDDPVDEDLHIVRILAKRCRYAAEACAPSLGKPTHKLALAARKLQDVLGELNDAVVAERWLRDWANHSRSGAGAFAAGELAALEREAASQARALAESVETRQSRRAMIPPLDDGGGTHNVRRAKRGADHGRRETRPGARRTLRQGSRHNGEPHRPRPPRSVASGQSEPNPPHCGRRQSRDC